jgi:hypothetical protein
MFTHLSIYIPYKKYDLKIEKVGKIKLIQTLVNLTHLEMSSAKVYYGETQCTGKKKDGLPCQNFAYYSQAGLTVCGVHSKESLRQKLPNNPNKKQIVAQTAADHAKSIEDMAALNKANGIKGHVVCYKMAMMKNPGYVKGYLNVFPNYKHENRKDGLGLPSLSPKSIGPIDHKQPGLPIALNLENFHQGNKVFPSEVDIVTGEPTKEFFDTQMAMYQDKIPHRHKDAASSNANSTNSTNKNIPSYSIWVTPDGIKNKINYFTSRQFYCTFYERSVLKDPAYLDLLNKINDGYCMRIIGFDAYEVLPHQSLEDCYKDITRPFGHELVLYTMLTSEPKTWPWRKYKTFVF